MVVALDEAKPSQAALDWALKHVVRDGDVLHLISVSLLAPMAVSRRPSGCARRCFSPVAARSAFTVDEGVYCSLLSFLW